MNAEVLKGSFTLGAADFSRKALLAATVLLCARFLPPRTFGDYIFLLSFYQIFSVLGAAGLPSSLMRAVARGGRSGTRTAFASVLARLVYIIPTALVMYVVMRLMGFWHEYFWALGMLILMMVVRGAAENVTFIFQGDEDQISCAKIGVTQSAITLLATLAICLTSKNLLLLIGAYVLGGLLSAIYAFYLLRAKDPERQEPHLTIARETRSLLEGSHWLNAGASVAAAYNRIDVLLLRRLLTSEAVAIYGVPYRILDLTQIVPSSLAATILPGLCRSEQSTSGNAHPRAAIRFLLVIALLMVVVVTTTASRITLLLFGAKYQKSIPVLQIVIWATVPMFWNFVLNAQLIANSFDRAILYGASIALALNVSLNLLLIPKFGYFACAVVTLITECGLLAANLRFVSKVGAAAWPESFSRLAVTTVLVAGFCICWTRPSPTYSLVSVVVLVLALLAVPLSWSDFSNPGRPEDLTRSTSPATRTIG
jgi:O-antigen/teichoic acid export membrane protein